MKKLVLLALLMCLTMSVFAQMIDEKTLEKEAKETFGEDLVAGADSIKTRFPLTASGLTFNTSVYIENASKDAIYKALKEYLSVQIGSQDKFAFNSEKDGILDITPHLCCLGWYKMDSSTKSCMYLPATLRYIVKDDSVKISCYFNGYFGVTSTKEKKKKGSVFKRIGDIASSVGVLGIAGGALGGAAGVVSAGAKIANVGTMVGVVGSIQDIVTGTAGTSIMPSIANVNWELKGLYPFCDNNENKELYAKLLCMSVVVIQNTLSEQSKSIEELQIERIEKDTESIEETPTSEQSEEATEAVEQND